MKGRDKGRRISGIGNGMGIIDAEGGFADGCSDVASDTGET